MDIEDIVRELLASPERISCICPEKLEDEIGIAVLCVDGTEDFYVVETKEIQEHIWEKLVEERSALNLVQFDDMLFAPRHIMHVNFLQSKQYGLEVFIGFINHPIENEMWYTQDRYEDLEPAYFALIKLLSTLQNLRATTFFNATIH